MNDYILQVENLKTYFKLDTGTLKAVDDVTFYLKRNETIGIIGESGCGKSVTAHSILRTVQNPGKVLGGRILYDDGSGPVDLVTCSPDSKAMRKLRGKDISMIFQEPMASLSPVYTIGSMDQVRKPPTSRETVKPIHRAGRFHNFSSSVRSSIILPPP